MTHTQLTNAELSAYNAAYGLVYEQTKGNHTAAALAGDDAVITYRRKQREQRERNTAPVQKARALAAAQLFPDNDERDAAQEAADDRA